MGEVDVLKAIQMLPGINRLAKATVASTSRQRPRPKPSLLDNAAIYNASHLFGFSGVFNADAISSVEVYKEACPQGLGGRVLASLTLD